MTPTDRPAAQGSHYPRIPKLDRLSEVSFVRDAIHAMPPDYVNLLRQRGGEATSSEDRRRVILLASAGWVAWDCEDGFVRGIRYSVRSLVRYVMTHYEGEFRET